MHSPFICRIGFIDFWLYPFENRSVELCSLSIDVDAILFRKSAGNANRSFLARLRRRRTRCHDIDRARVTYCPWRKLCEWPHLRGRITLYMVNEAPYVCLVHMLNRVIAKVAALTVPFFAALKYRLVGKGPATWVVRCNEKSLVSTTRRTAGCKRVRTFIDEMWLE